MTSNTPQNLHLSAGLYRIVKDVCPPFAWRTVRKILNRKPFIEYRYGFPDWQAAAQAAHGYDTQAIIEKVVGACRNVRDGLTVYERDGYEFKEIDYSWPLLAALLLAASDHSPSIFLDFGGGLGSTYRQNQKYLSLLNSSLQWRIVEQEAFVRIGRHEFSTPELSFHSTLGEAAEDGNINAILFCSSICYIQNPYEIIAESKNIGPRYIIFDRTPVSTNECDSFSIQINNSPSHSSDYAVRIFGKDKLQDALKDNYSLVEEWICPYQPDPASVSKGFLFRKRT